MKIERYYWKVLSHFRGFRELGKKTCIYKPLQIDNTDGISIGNEVNIMHYAWLIGTQYMEEFGLRIDDGTTIGHFAHIVARKKVHIGKNVLVADRVFISDCTHSYEDVTQPVQKQAIELLGEVSIGDDSWIGENVSILGASVGKHCVIGANSVVTTDIPDFCVAVGVPASIIKRYDISWKRWI